MKKVALILFVVLLAQVQIFACEYANFRNDLIGNVTSRIHTPCTEKTVNLEKSYVDLVCADQQLYRVNFENNQIYFITNTTSKHPFTTQCWIEGSISASCQVQLKEQKCDSWM